MIAVIVPTKRKSIFLFFGRVFHDVEELVMAILNYVDQHNLKPKPFIWTANAADILEKVKRARKVLDNQQSG